MVRLGVTAVLLASVHPLLLLLPLTALPTAWTGARASRITEECTEATAERVRRHRHLFHTATTTAAAGELRVYGLAEELVRRHAETWEEVTVATAWARLRGGMVRSLGWVAFAAGTAAAIAFTVAQAAAGGASGGDVLMVVALAQDLTVQANRAVTLAHDSAGIHRAVGRLLWLRDYAASARCPVDDPAPVPERLEGGIVLEGVGFSYPATSATVLSDVELRLPAGSVTAVVGANGAGKSTLVKLLTGCYEPTQGRIMVDGVDLRRMDLDAWRRRVSAGFQDFSRLELVLREAVGVGDLARIDDAGRVRAALARSQASDLGTALPRGLESQLGLQFEGSELSEGQWQKVAIARSLMDDGPLLLILDEPTSGLDATAEHRLFHEYAAAASASASRHGTVTVLISHRFSTVRLADLIVVLDGGRVVGAGTHAELMAAGGLYAELYATQAAAYQ